MLTPRQSEVLDTIIRLTRKEGSPPTTRELMKAIGVTSPHAVTCHVKALRKKGMIEPQKRPKRHRGLRVIGLCPCCGK